MMRPRPRLTPWSNWALALTALVVALPPLSPVGAQFPDLTVLLAREKPVGNRLDVFCRILHDQKFQPLTSSKDLDPHNSVLLLLGRQDPVVALPGGLGDFLDHGGAVLIATDKPIEATELAAKVLELTGFQVDPNHYVCPEAQLEKCYRRLDYCPLLEPIPSATPNLFRNPREHGASNLVVATNLPSCLRRMGPQFATEVQILANLPPGIVAETQKDRTIQNRAFMISVQTDTGGRLLFVADHSIFINQMMLPEDNGNVEFTVNCLRWLRGDNNGKNFALLVEDGKVVDNFFVPLQPASSNGGLPPIKENQVLDSMNTLVGKADEGLDDVEKRDLFNRSLLRTLSANGHSPWHVVGTLFAMLTIVALVTGFFRFVLVGFQHQAPTTPALARLVQHQEPTELLLDQRQQGMFQIRNLWEVARESARQCFASAGVVAKTSDPLPALSVRGGWWQRRKVRRQVARLWAIAFGARPAPVRPVDWPRLVGQLNELKTALANGSVRLS